MTKIGHKCPDCQGSGTQGVTGTIECYLCEGRGKIK